jgi:hypothetical protein
MQNPATETAAANRSEPFRIAGLAPQDATQGYDVDVYIQRALDAGVKPWDPRFAGLVLCKSSSAADREKVVALSLGGF